MGRSYGVSETVAYDTARMNDIPSGALEHNLCCELFRPGTTVHAALLSSLGFLGIIIILLDIFLPVFSFHNDFSIAKKPSFIHPIFHHSIYITNAECSDVCRFFLSRSHAEATVIQFSPRTYIELKY